MSAIVIEKGWQGSTKVTYRNVQIRTQKLNYCPSPHYSPIDKTITRQFPIITKFIQTRCLHHTMPEPFAFEMELLRDEKNMVTGFTISNFGVKNLRFVKIK